MGSVKVLLECGEARRPIHSKAGVSPGRVTPARRSVFPSPSPSPSPPASFRLLRYFPRHPPPPCTVFASPASWRHFRLCVPARVRSRAAPPRPSSGRWRRGRGVLCACSVPSGRRQSAARMGSAGRGRHFRAR